MPRAKKPMRQVSAKKASWNAQYSKALRAAKQKQINERGTTYCERCDKNGEVDGHHLNGRIKERILVFRLVCRIDHDWIHENANAAREEGWLV